MWSSSSPPQAFTSMPPRAWLVLLLLCSVWPPPARGSGRALGQSPAANPAAPSSPQPESCSQCPAAGSPAATESQATCSALTDDERARMRSAIIKVCSSAACPLTPLTSCSACCQGLPARDSPEWRKYAACMCSGQLEGLDSFIEIPDLMKGCGCGNPAPPPPQPPGLIRLSGTATPTDASGGAAALYTASGGSSGTVSTPRPATAAASASGNNDTAIANILNIIQFNNGPSVMDGLQSAKAAAAAGSNNQQSNAAAAAQATPGAGGAATAAAETVPVSTTSSSSSSSKSG